MLCFTLSKIYPLLFLAFCIAQAITPSHPPSGGREGPLRSEGVAGGSQPAAQSRPPPTYAQAAAGQGHAASPAHDPPSAIHGEGPSSQSQAPGKPAAAPISPAEVRALHLQLDEQLHARQGGPIRIAAHMIFPEALPNNDAVNAQLRDMAVTAMSQVKDIMKDHKIDTSDKKNELNALTVLAVGREIFISTTLKRTWKGRNGLRAPSKEVTDILSKCSKRHIAAFDAAAAATDSAGPTPSTERPTQNKPSDDLTTDPRENDQHHLHRRSGACAEIMVAEMFFRANPGATLKDGRMITVNPRGGYFPACGVGIQELPSIIDKGSPDTDWGCKMFLSESIVRELPKSTQRQAYDLTKMAGGVPEFTVISLA